MSNAGCAVYQAMLQAQITILKCTRSGLITRLNRLAFEVDQLEAVIVQTRQLASRLAAGAGAVLKAKSGVERGRWAYAKGQYQIATQTLHILTIGDRPALVWTERADLEKLYGSMIRW